MDLTPEKVREIQKISQEPVSLETPIGEEDDSHLGDFIEDAEAIVPVDAASFILLQEQLDGVMESLTDRERKALRDRYDGLPQACGGLLVSDRQDSSQERQADGRDDPALAPPSREAMSRGGRPSRCLRRREGRRGLPRRGE